MSDNRRKSISHMLYDLVETGRRISAKERDQRPRDQPQGDGARLIAIHWLLSPAVAVKIENAAELFTGALCPACDMPRGARTEQPMCVRYDDRIGRSCDGLQARGPNALRGLAATLYSDRFLDLLTEAERANAAWRAVEVLNRKKTKRELFEFLGSAVRVRAIALRGGYLERFECRECQFQSAPVYAMVGSLPDWLNPTGDLSYGGQPSMFVSSDELAEPAPSIFTLGASRWGPSLVVSAARPWPRAATPGIMGVSRHPLGVVPPDLAVAENARCAAG